MKKLHKKFSKIVFGLLACVLLFLVLPGALLKEGEGTNLTIVTSLGIDKESNEFEISMQILVASSARENASKSVVIASSGKTITDAFNNVAIKFGKNIGLEHCGVIVLGEGLKNENVFEIFDSFYRLGKITLYTSIVGYEGKAQDFLLIANNLSAKSNFNLTKTLSQSKKILNAAEVTSLGTFFNKYFEKSSTCPITYFAKTNLNDDNDQELELSHLLELLNNNKSCYIYKEGKRIIKLSPEQTLAYNFTNNYATKGVVVLDNLVDEPFKNATVSLRIRNQKYKPKLKFENDKFVLTMKISVTCETIEINQTQKTTQIYKSLNDYLTDEVKEKLKEKITDKIEEVFTLGKESNIDIFKIETLFYKNKNRKYRRQNKTGTDFLNSCEIEVDFEIKTFK